MDLSNSVELTCGLINHWPSNFNVCIALENVYMYMKKNIYEEFCEVIYLFIYYWKVLTILHIIYIYIYIYMELILINIWNSLLPPICDGELYLDLFNWNFEIPLHFWNMPSFLMCLKRKWKLKLVCNTITCLDVKLKITARLLLP